jgi:hypothetical protein
VSFEEATADVLTRPYHTLAILLQVGLIALATLAPASTASAEIRVTKLVSGPPSEGNVCSVNRRHDCDTPVTSDGRHVLFFTDEFGEKMYLWSDGGMTLIPGGEAFCGPVTTACDYELSADGQHVFYETHDAVTLDDADGTQQDVYEWSRGRAMLLSQPDPPSGGVPLWADLKFVSDDVSRAIMGIHGNLWTNGDFVGSAWERIAGELRPFPSADAQSVASFAVFRDGASKDGSRVLFLTHSPLVASDTDACPEPFPDYYSPGGCVDVYERSPDGVRLISAGSVAGGGDYYVQYVRFLGASSDGSRVFFATRERLVPEDIDECVVNGTPQPCEREDVYEYSNGETKLLYQQHDPRAETYFGRVTPDGKRVFFETDEPLVAADADSCPGRSAYFAPGCFDVYELSHGRFKLLSIGTEVGAGSFGASFQGASEDGRRVFFRTHEPLVAEDNDSCPGYEPPACADIYERFNAGTTLVSQGDDVATVPQSATFLGASADGRRVFFGTHERLVADDRDCEKPVPDGECWDIYERFKGETTLISTGPTDPHARCYPDYFCTRFIAASRDGKRAFFVSPDPLTADDADEEAPSDDIFLSAPCHLKKAHRAC